MSTLALSCLMHGTPAVLHKIAKRVGALLVGLEDARRMAERFKTLSRLSDADLARRGLTRAEIPQAVLGSTR